MFGIDAVDHYTYVLTNIVLRIRMLAKDAVENIISMPSHHKQDDYAHESTNIVIRTRIVAAMEGAIVIRIIFLVAFLNGDDYVENESCCGIDDVDDDDDDYDYDCDDDNGDCNDTNDICDNEEYI
ncbi:hypothetical protein PoB_006085600 [Plakobranchus ocellatus]|uniref:Uncharacterized protein n=1 Tax=Plakobranchus ocellatus TaxID=259542 RepID=A0AAV4CRC7_9GAST|nr:hypothetical protein PoB_006085600 [Plakobranchus ocellatus]